MEEIFKAQTDIGSSIKWDWTIINHLSNFFELIFREFAIKILHFIYFITDLYVHCLV